MASLCSFGYELDLNRLCEEEKSKLRDQTELIRRISPLILRGDLYRLRDPFEGNSFCFEIVSKDKNSAYVVYQNFLAKANPPVERLRLKGLRPERVYTIEQLNLTQTGASLMNAGIVLPWFFGDFAVYAFTISAKQ